MPVKLCLGLRRRKEGRSKTSGLGNGHLYVLLESTPTGHRLRLGSLHGGAAASIRLGLVGLGAAAILAVASISGGELGNAVPALLAGGGVLIANGALRVRGWARLRAQQMETLAAQLALPAGSRTEEPRGS